MHLKIVSIIAMFLLPGSVFSFPAGGVLAAMGSKGTQWEKTLPTAASPVHLSVLISPDAQLMVNGTPTTSKGPIRDFVSPPIVPGYRYMYELTATWVENGKTIVRTKEIEVAPGSHVSVILDSRGGMKRLPSPPSHP